MAPSQIRVASDASIIRIDEEDLEQMQGGGRGPTVTDVEISHKDGKTTKFFIGIGINDQGRAVCEVSTNGPVVRPKSVRKTITGFKRDPWFPRNL